MSDRTTLTPEARQRLDRLYRLYGTRVLAFARTRTREAEAAQDVAMETWIKAGLGLHRLRAADAEAFGWLCTIVRHVAVDYYHRYETPRDWSEPVSSRALPADPSAEDVALEEESAPADSPLLEPLLATLPERDRTVVRLRLEGLTYGAIGSHVDRSEGAAYWRYHRAVRTLRARQTADTQAVAA
ncbi:RNA polymerase sigma factor [Streptomyces sp. NPDC007063]|uniref:RNA polymerase sigma factor n=1 Tax=Streptomyces sp. NPDC007063 TaxID=3364772 RepID=UPI0036A4AC02